MVKVYFTVLLTFSLNTISAGLPADEPRIKNPGLRFTENKGQVRGFDGAVHPEVKFVAGDDKLRLFFLTDGISYQFHKVHDAEGSSSSNMRDWKKRSGEHKEVRVETFRMDMQLTGANKRALVTTTGRSADYEQHYNRDALDVHHFQTITYHDIYPGIDWLLRCGDQYIKYEFVVRPGADPSQIRIRFFHHESISLDKEGDLLVGNSMGTITEQAPVSFQGDRAVSTKFILTGDELAFSVADFDRARALVIDPKVIWGSYFGGGGLEVGKACTYDGLGNYYLTGRTESNVNIASGGHQNNIGSYTDAFLAKFTTGGSLLWATYYGGNAYDTGAGCATDVAGNVYLAGETMSPNSIAAGGHQAILGGGVDAFLVKFNTWGQRVWATYYGGAQSEWAGGCATDASGNIYLAGATTSSGLATVNAHQTSFLGGADALVVKFSSTGTRQWSTYYGGWSSDNAASCATDASGNVYIAGSTSSASYIASNGHQNINDGLADAYLSKFSGNGSLLWGTYYGGSSNDYGFVCTTDQTGNVYLGGLTNSGNNISTNQTTYAGSGDSFVVKFSTSGSRTWGTYAGSATNTEQGFACAADGSGNVYLGGPSLYKFSSFGSLLWEYQGFGPCMINGCAVAGTGELLVAGETHNANTNISGGYQSLYWGAGDAFIALLNTCNPPATPGAIAGPTMVCTPGTIAMTYSVQNDPAALSYSWSLQGAWTLTSTTNVIDVIAPGGGLIKVAATNTCGSSNASALFVAKVNPPQISVSTGVGAFCRGMSVPLTAKGAETYTWTWGPTGNTYTVSPLFPTTYTVQGTANTGCTNTATYYLEPDTTTVFNFTVNGMNANFSIRNPACNSFQWEYGDGSSSTITPNPAVTYQNAGTYDVCLTCNGLPLSCARCINIKVPSTHIGGVGLTESNSDPLISLFPNPVENKFIIVLPIPCKATLLNSLGQTVMALSLHDGENLVDVASQPAGVYYLKVESDFGTRSFRIIRQ